MAITWYIPKTKESKVLGDFVRVSNHYLKFSSDVHKNLFKGRPYIQIGFDSAENAIYIAPKIDSTTAGLKIAPLSKTQLDVLSIQWPKFIEINKIHFDKPCDFKPVVVAKDENPVYKIIIAKC